MEGKLGERESFEGKDRGLIPCSTMPCVDPATLPPEAFECSQSPDVRYASCEAPEYMFHF